jgi:hypothetical protein
MSAATATPDAIRRSARFPDLSSIETPCQAGCRRDHSENGPLLGEQQTTAAGEQILQEKSIFPGAVGTGGEFLRIVNMILTADDRSGKRNDHPRPARESRSTAGTDPSATRRARAFPLDLTHP